jgi:hypothetical protein
VRVRAQPGVSEPVGKQFGKQGSPPRAAEEATQGICCSEVSNCRYRASGSGRPALVLLCHATPKTLVTGGDSGVRQGGQGAGGHGVHEGGR